MSRACEEKAAAACYTQHTAARLLSYGFSQGTLLLLAGLVCGNLAFQVCLNGIPAGSLIGATDSASPPSVFNAANQYSRSAITEPGSSAKADLCYRVTTNITVRRGLRYLKGDKAFGTL